MTLKQVSEVIWRFYQVGSAKATNQTLTESDMMQYAKAALSAMMREQYFRSKKSLDGEEYYFYSQILSIKRFALTDTDKRGMRRADMGDVDLYRLPKNIHFTNIYPVADGCVGGDGSIELSQVSAGEENFYLGGDYDFFKFYVVKGKGINAYHLPPCITALDIETTYDSPDIDVSLDQAMDVANTVLGVSLKVKPFPVKVVDNSFDKNVLELKRRLQEQQSQI